MADPAASGPAAALRWLRGRSLAEYADGRRDNILLMRLLAAFLVVLGHCGLAGPGAWIFDPIALVFRNMAAHLVGLMMFFTISGFLITLSFERRPHLLRFLRARALRLMPALVVCVLAWAFVLGPLLSSVPLRVYFDPARDDNPYGYARAAISLIEPLRLHLPGLFEHNPANSAVNGPLWSISREASLYLWVAAAGTLRLLRLRWLTSIAIATLFAWLIVVPMMTGPFLQTRHLDLVVQGFFGAGVIACLLRHRVPVSTPLMIILAVVCFASRHSIHSLPVIWLTVGYFTLWLAYVPVLPAIPANVDVSYGVYLWAWPVQQAIVQTGVVREPILLFVIVVPVLLVIGLLSWLAVEKPALRLKEWRSAAISRRASPADTRTASSILRGSLGRARADGPRPGTETV